MSKDSIDSNQDSYHISKEMVEVRQAYCDSIFGSWKEGDAALFPVRGSDYLETKKKIHATSPVLRLIRLDLYSDPKVKTHVFPQLRSTLAVRCGNTERR